LNRVKLAPTPWQPGSRSGGETLTFIPADAKLRPLRDQIIVEAEELIHSRILYVDTRTRPVKGTVLAVGPGCYPKKYDHAEKHKRSKMWDSTRFRPTDVKVGDKVELGGAEQGGYAFDQFYWGEKLCVIVREEDVALVREG
jgi:co-chaperonin GroES (HSP10)